jgi:hypothetical protein
VNDYVAAAYIVFLALILIYVVIMAVRQLRLTQEIAELEELVRERDASQPPPREVNAA